MRPCSILLGAIPVFGQRRFAEMCRVMHTANSDGRTSGLNNLRQLAFRAQFTDGSSGLFVSNRVAIPEPSSLLLAALAAAGLLWRRRVRESLGSRGTLLFANRPVESLWVERHSSQLAQISVN